MKVIHSQIFTGPRTVDLEDALTGELQRSDRDSGGAVEDAKEVADRTAAAVAKLVAALVEADRLTLAQAEEICDVRGNLSAVPSRDFIGG